MSKEVGVLVIHGMGSQKPSFDHELVEELKDRLGSEYERFAFERVFWQDLLEDRQREFLSSARRNNDLDAMVARKFVVSAFGDALAYQRVGGANTAYAEIHDRVGRQIKSLRESQLGGNDRPLVVIAHSLGAHIISNYIWDAQTGKKTPSGNDFEDMKTLAGFITFGCNIPLFSFAYSDVKAIGFPGEALSSEIKAKARWHNYYDPDDILGYPLKQLSESYDAAVDEDIPINVGGALTGWNPAAHGKYWTDNDFTVPVARFLGSLV